MTRKGKARFYEADGGAIPAFAKHFGIFQKVTGGNPLFKFRFIHKVIMNPILLCPSGGTGSVAYRIIYVIGSAEDFIQDGAFATTRRCRKDYQKAAAFFYQNVCYVLSLIRG